MKLRLKEQQSLPVVLKAVRPLRRLRPRQGAVDERQVAIPAYRKKKQC